MNYHLKIKIKSLAAEAKIIRAEEVKYKHHIQRLNAQVQGALHATITWNSGIEPNSGNPHDFAKDPVRYAGWKTGFKYKAPNPEQVIEYTSAHDAARHSLHQHRIKDVRGEARHALLAYGFIRGREYKKIENKCDKEPDWERVQKLVEKYSGQDIRLTRQRFAGWKPQQEKAA